MGSRSPLKVVPSGKLTPWKEIVWILLFSALLVVGLASIQELVRHSQVYFPFLHLSPHPLKIDIALDRRDFHRILEKDDPAFIDVNRLVDLLSDRDKCFSLYEKTQMADWLLKYGDKTHAAMAAGALAWIYEEDAGLPDHIAKAKKWYAKAEAISGNYEPDGENILRLDVNGKSITVQGVLAGHLGGVGPNTGWEIYLDKPVTLGDKRILKDLQVVSAPRIQDLWDDRPVQIEGTIDWKSVGQWGGIRLIPDHVKKIEKSAEEIKAILIRDR